MKRKNPVALVTFIKRITKVNEGLVESVVIEKAKSKGQH